MTGHRKRADQRLEAVLPNSLWADPRDDYRRLMRDLKSRNPQAYEAAVQYFDQRVAARIAESDADPLDEWIEFGRYLAELSAPGRTVLIDSTGLSEAYRRPAAEGTLVLHLPDRSGARAIVIARPKAPTPPQLAAHELLAL